MSGKAKERKSRAISWAKSIVSNPSALFLDTETTCFGPSAEIVDIGVVDLTGNIVFKSLIRPVRPIPADATAVHGIANSTLLTLRIGHTLFPSSPS